jgi:hypothetical protein
VYGNPSILVAAQEKMETSIIAINVLALVIALPNFWWMITGTSLNNNRSILFFSILLTFSSFVRCNDCKECDRERCYHWRIGDKDFMAAF